MTSFNCLSLPFSDIGFLTWDGDRLIDWEKLAIYGLDGSKSNLGVRYGYRFDNALRSNDGRYVIVYETFGTKGIIIADGQFLREINRSYYCADSYEFPLEIFTLSDGRTALAHCPNDHNRIEIELIDTGESLTPHEAREATDIFHAGLAVDPSGAWLMSAGWIWHPYYEVRFFSVAEALDDPRALDQSGFGVDHSAEIGSAAFLGPDLAVLASDPDEEPFDSDPESGHQGMIGLFRPSAQRWESRVPVDAPVGKMLPVDDDHVLALYEHPKLINVRSGRIIDSWPEIDSGAWKGCISFNAKIPPMNWDPVSKRLAVAGANEIHVLAHAT